MRVDLFARNACIVFRIVLVYGLEVRECTGILAGYGMALMAYSLSVHSDAAACGSLVAVSAAVAQVSPAWLFCYFSPPGD